MRQAFEANTAVAIYRSLRIVDAAIKELKHSGFDLRRVSIVGKDLHYGEADKADLADELQEGQGKTFWRRMLKVLPGRTVYSLPDDEFVIVSGPLSECVTAALDNPVIFGRLSTLCAALYILGVPTEKALGFEEVVQQNKFLMLANGTMDEIIVARRVFQSVNGGPLSGDV